MNIDDLRAIEDAYEMGDKLSQLSSEILALVDAAKEAQWDYRVDSPICVALDAFNAKLEEL